MARMHKSVTVERITAGAEESMFGIGNPGICIACGEDADGCEPDARGYDCESCDEPKVYGCEELLMMTC